MSSNANFTEVGLVAASRENAFDPKEPHVRDKLMSDESASPTSEERAQDTLVSIPITGNRSSRAIPVILIVLNFGVTIVMLVFIYYPIYFSKDGNAITENLVLMQLFVALPATYLGLSTASVLRRLYIQRFICLYQQGKLKPLERVECTVAVGVSGFRESYKGWRIGMPIMLAGAITPALLACLTITPVTIGFVPEALVYPYHDKNHCFSSGSNLTELSLWSWQSTESPPYLGVNRSAVIDCETETISSVVSALTAKSYAYAYAIGGLLVDRAAVAAPIDPPGNPGGEFGSVNRHPEFQWSSFCFPTLASNPARCRLAPEAKFNVSSNWLGININGCNFTNDGLKVDPTIHGATVFAPCPDMTKPGSVKIAFGAVNDAALVWAIAMQDRTFNATSTSYDSLNKSRISYAIECTIDIAPSVSFRQMTLSRKPAYATGVVDTFPFHVTGNRSIPCVPKYPSGGGNIALSSFLSDRALVVGATSSRVLLLENLLMDGTMMALHKFISLFNPDRVPELDPTDVYTFEGSHNALEDALGTLSGMGLGMYWGAQTRNVSAGALQIANGQGGYSGWRVGNDRSYNVIWAIPTFSSTITLSYLLYWAIKSGGL